MEAAIRHLRPRARATENQVVWVASNQAGTFGSLRFVCSAKIVGPGGEVLATTGAEPGLASATLDVQAELDGDSQRRDVQPRDRRPELYGSVTAVLERRRAELTVDA